MQNQGGLRWVFLVAVAAVGLNLRPFIASIGPLAESIHAGTGLGSYGLAMLTFVPMVLMGCVAFLGPGLQRIAGTRPVILSALATISLGTILRLFVSSGWMMIATAAVIGAGVAVVQAVFPGIIKRQFPDQAGPIAGLYSAMLLGGGALGAQASPVIADLTGSWRIGLASLAALGFVAVAVAWIALPSDAPRNQEGNLVRNLLAKPRAWLLMVFFGLVNGGYTSVVVWLAPHYQQLGWGASASGSLLAIMAVFQAAAALILPVLACRNGMDRRPWLWFTLGCQFAGFVGFAFAPHAAPFAFVALTGAGLGGCFALSMVVALDHLADPAQATALSAVMQGGGFLLAATPPMIVSALHDLTGSFAAGWKWHLGSILIAAALTARLAPRGYAAAMPLAPAATNADRSFG